MSIRPEHFRTIVHAILGRYVDPDLRHLLERPADGLRLGEDLGIDSLTLMEIVQRLEDTLQIVILDSELRHMRTLGEVWQSIECALNRNGVPGVVQADFPS